MGKTIIFDNHKKFEVEGWSKRKKPHGDFNTCFWMFLHILILNIKCFKLPYLHSDHKYTFPSAWRTVACAAWCQEQYCVRTQGYHGISTTAAQSSSSHEKSSCHFWNLKTLVKRIWATIIMRKIVKCVVHLDRMLFTIVWTSANRLWRWQRFLA